MGPRGDAIVQFDWCVGEILTTLDRLELAENTLVILTSDNGPVLDDGYKDEAVEKLGDHKPAGPLRGGKYSIFEGGTRVPVHRALARAREARRERRARQPGGFSGVVRRAGRAEARDADAPDSSTSCPRCSAIHRTGATTSSSTRTAWRCARATGNTSSPARCRAFQAADRHRDRELSCPNSTIFRTMRVKRKMSPPNMRIA